MHTPTHLKILIASSQPQLKIQLIRPISLIFPPEIRLLIYNLSFSTRWQRQALPKIQTYGPPPLISAFLYRFTLSANPFTTRFLLLEAKANSLMKSVKCWLETGRTCSPRRRGYWNTSKGRLNGRRDIKSRRWSMRQAFIQS